MCTPWKRSYRKLCTAKHGCWEPNFWSYARSVNTINFWCLSPSSGGFFFFFYDAFSYIFVLRKFCFIVSFLSVSDSSTLLLSTKVKFLEESLLLFSRCSLSWPFTTLQCSSDVFFPYVPSQKCLLLLVLPRGLVEWMRRWAWKYL